jgi:hypothetical protein
LLRENFQKFLFLLSFYKEIDQNLACSSLLHLNDWWRPPPPFIFKNFKGGRNGRRPTRIFFCNTIYNVGSKYFAVKQ